MTEGYWTRIADSRIGRRRVLLTSGTGVSAAVLLAACGGGSDSKNRNSREKYATHTHLPCCSQLADKRGQTVDGSWNFEGAPKNF